MIQASQKKRGRPPKHGMSSTREYNIWRGMLARCENVKSASWKHYGGRGIVVCARWHDVFAFVEDMGNAPAGMSLDRVDVNGNYEPTNCRWATTVQQNNNTRFNRLILMDGRLVTVAEYARSTNEPYLIVYQRAAKARLLIRRTPRGGLT